MKQRTGRVGLNSVGCVDRGIAKRPRRYCIDSAKIAFPYPFHPGLYCVGCVRV